MPAQWTAEIIGKMHLNGISASRLAEAVGWHPKYLSAVLNGRKNPNGAEEKVRNALAALCSGSANQGD